MPQSNEGIRFYDGDVGADPVVGGAEEDGFAPSFRLPSLRVSVGRDGENDDGAFVGAVVGSQSVFVRASGQKLSA